MAAVAGLRRDRSTDVAGILSRQYDARAVALTDTGTSALLLLLQKLVPRGGTIGLPGYACIDLTTAAVGAGVRVRLYDLDSSTLSPDLDSVRSMIQRGVDAIVVAHLLGYPADVPAVRQLAAEHGIPVIEDAAQGSGGALNGKALGALGDGSILSFGRGKGTTAGFGGAILARTSELADWTSGLRSRLRPKSRGVAAVVSVVAQGVFSHPLLYAIPASIPALRLGEMVYHPPHVPHAMTVGSAAILEFTLGLAQREAAARRERAKELLTAVRAARGITPVRPIGGGEPGYLRLAILTSFGSRGQRADLGAVRCYPMTLDEHVQLHPLLHTGEVAGSGSRHLRDSLITVPTHSGSGHAYRAALAEWLIAGYRSPRFVPAVS